jgi:hypothetical protein
MRPVLGLGQARRGIRHGIPIDALDLFVVMLQARQNQIHAQSPILDDPLRHLLGVPISWVRKPSLY